MASRPLMGARSGGHDKPDVFRRKESVGSVSSDAEASLVADRHPCCACCHRQPSEVSFAKVLEQEQQHMARMYRKRRQATSRFGADASQQPRPRRRFSVALSGGGIRAAAFQSGVLWRLAEEGMLEDVEFLSAVSGGGWLSTAYATNLHAAQSRPPATPVSSDDSADDDVERPVDEAAAVRDWYLDVVARTICRMQENAGGFIRDVTGSQGAFGMPQDGSGSCPRLLDLPLLLVVLLFQLLRNPLSLVALLAVPTMESMDLFFGSALRASLCAPRHDYKDDMVAAGRLDMETLEDMMILFYKWSMIPKVVLATAIFGLLTFVFWLLAGALKPGGRRDQCGQMPFQLVNALKAFCLRITLLSVASLVAMHLLLVVQWYQSTSNEHMNNARILWCKNYILNVTAQHARAERCSNNLHGQPWFEFVKENISLQPNPVMPNTTLRESVVESQDIPFLNQFRSASNVIWEMLLAVVLLAAFLSPCISGIFMGVVNMALMFSFFWIFMVAAQFRVYAPLTGQLLFGHVPFDTERWYWFTTCCMVVGFFSFPLQETGSFWHRYYRRSLRMNFFANGKDITFKQMQDNPWCPFVLLTGTVNDYKRFGDKLSISEISFSALHMGSEKMGYYATPPWRSLAHCTALTSAACLDTITLSMTDRVRYRFWLEMFDLSWGDFVLLESESDIAGRKQAKHYCESGDSTDGGAGDESPYEHALRCTSFRFFCESSQEPTRLIWWRRMPFFILYLIYQFSLYLGFHWAEQSEKCDWARSCFLLAWLVLSIVCFLSFFTFLPCFSCLAYDPLVRRFHQATRYFYLGNVPPGLVYVTDGGVQDCTAIMQLLRRKRDCILLVLAAADPKDELLVLRATMEMAISERIGCFYDPENEKRDFRIMLEEYQNRKAWTYFEVGIRYGWSYSTEADERLGRLVVVKNRLPHSEDDAGRGYNDFCRPLLTEELIRGEVDSEEDVFDSDDPLAKMKQVDLGGFGCSNCCHRAGFNCGRKFPHLDAFGYLWLTPQLFSCLCRHGHALSEKGVAAVAKFCQADSPEQKRCF